MKYYLAALFTCVYFCFSQAAVALSCEDTPTRNSYQIGSQLSQRPAADWFTRLLVADIDQPIDPVEVYGDHAYRETLNNGWIFALLRQEHGWSLRLYDKKRSVGGVDLTSITPPYSGGVPNARDIFGWHFRNQPNTGPNSGDVNAPQDLRLFAFSTSLIDTGGFKPSRSTSTERYTDPPEQEGRGWLQILEFGLSGLEEGQRAKMNYLKFDACLTWPKSIEQIEDERGLAIVDYIDEEVEGFGSCGLDFRKYRLQARLRPRYLTGDLDGDDSGDEFAQVIRISDGKKDLVLCRAGTWHHFVGSIDDSEDLTLTLKALEKWKLVPNDFAVAGAKGGNTAWPAADGDVLVLERIEKSMYLVYWAGNRLHAQKIYRYIEPS